MVCLSRVCHFNFKGFLTQILLGPFLNILIHLILFIYSFIFEAFI